MMEITALHFDTQRPIRVTVADGRITSVCAAETSNEDALRLPTIAPGLLDIQVNGFAGRWFSSEELTSDDVHQIVISLVERGVARCLPTLITNSAEALQHGMSTIAAACRNDALVASAVRGIHLEGPWISPEDGPRGAHPIQHVRPGSVAEFDRLFDASGRLLRLLTLAPEIPNCLDVIRAAKRKGVAVSIGHTAASAEEICAAVDAGATLSTHLGNGCAGLMHRHANPIWPQLADDRLSAGVISDGCHLPDNVLASIVRCKTPRRIVMTCDVSGFAGCSVGRHVHGDLAVEVLSDGRIVVAGQRQYLAGSGATTLDCIPQLLSATSLSPADVWRLVTHNPEVALQQPHVTLQEGSEATFNVWRLHSDAQGAGNRIATGATSVFRPVETVVRGIRIASVA
jgi:N-acetylglucosamine-6-phosphate deacetylase